MKRKITIIVSKKNPGKPMDIRIVNFFNNRIHIFHGDFKSITIYSTARDRKDDASKPQEGTNDEN